MALSEKEKYQKGLSNFAHDVEEMNEDMSEKLFQASCVLL